MRALLGGGAGILAAVAITAQVACAVNPQRTKATCAGGYAPQFTITGQVNHKQIYDVNALRAQPNQTFVHDVFRTGTGFEQGGWSGVLLWDLITQADPTISPSRRNDLSRKSVLVTGSDCYEQTFSLGELAPTIGGTSQIVVAYAVDGQPLSSDDGMARIIAPGDKSGARNVRHVVRIEVLDP